MQAVIKLDTRITQATSDDGRVQVLSAPLTRLYGEYTLRDAATGEGMWRGEYIEADGKVAGRRVPSDVWAVAVALTREIDALNGAEEDASAQRAGAIADARWSDASARIAADMDRAESDL